MEAAASIVLSPALQVLFDRLASPLLERTADIFGFKDNLRSLRHALSRAQATLEDAEEQQFTSKAIRLWLSDLKNAAMDAQDLLEFFIAHETLEKETGKDVPQVLLTASNHPDNVRKVLQTLELSLSERFPLLSVRDPTLPRMADRRCDNRETSSFFVDSKIYGRDDDKDRLVQLLLSSAATSQVSQQGYGCVAECIPIIGIGGIGKTTLAQLTYNDKSIIQHFDLRVWISVSTVFSMKHILQTIIASATKDEGKLSKILSMAKFSIDWMIYDLEELLYESLHNKRYLIVLDDVWTEDQDDWDKLRPLFTAGLDGCKIIVTTRSKKIPFMMNFPNYQYHLKGMADDDCWALFKHRAFGLGEEVKYPNLVLIAKQIVKKCGGVPLAAKSLGSAMRLKRQERQWLFMRDCELWKLDASQHKVLPALMLSYHHLPSHLRQCFEFCSMFPKNYEFKKQQLIHLWMAGGLILQEGNKRPEDIGDEYFDDLLWMSFFEEAEQCDCGSTAIAYKMIDIIHDLARYVAGKEYVILEHGLSLHSPTQIRHSSLVPKGEITIPEALYEAEHLRSLLVIGGFGTVNNQSKLFSSFVYLRMLDLKRCDIDDLPRSLGGLICLRYLDMSYTRISMLPQSTSNLCLLQTLNLVGCGHLKALPFLGNMINMRHLNITGCNRLNEMPFGIQRLLQLQLLPLCVVSRNQRALTMLEHLNLYGELNITYLENTSSPDEAQSARLNMKENLESVGLHWGSQPLDQSFPRLLGKSRRDVVISSSQVAPQLCKRVEEVLDGLQPHNNLKKLVINGYPGIRFADWALPKMLITVDLINCTNCQHLPALGNLPLLKTLYMHGMEGVKCIGTEFYGDGTDVRFPSLEELSLSHFPNLEQWSCADDGNAFPHLSKLTVRSCPKLQQISLPQSLQHLELRDCNPTLMCIEHLTLLSVLVIEKIPELTSLPEGLFVSARLFSLEILSCPKLRSLPLKMGNLTALKSLTIRWCEELSTLPQSIEDLKALESLEIINCNNIISMPDGGIAGLSSLRTLSIENCNNLISLSSSLENLTFLEHLVIMYCPNLTSFPEGTGAQPLSALRSLTILGCPWFDSLPNELQNLRTLQCLEIGGCPNLTALPDWFEKLDSLRSLTICDCPNLMVLPPCLTLLTKLQHLSIQDCPQLEERCYGEDRSKIAHIPHQYIGSSQVTPVEPFIIQDTITSFGVFQRL
ncbi:putative disease resistance protein RGA1 [Rosa rugosa]|uniref:putative disease resistance protein RGA1 n=1 Tax=Rosa rugosa TaxID=74645 RepID=UPI002B406FFA|nr:putative disease resistance protein RGA1 [Rosa rugosa]